MTSITFYFQVHQPYRLRRYSYFDIGASDAYFDDELNEAIVKRVADRCYLPMNALLLETIEATGGGFRCSFSISGTALRQFETWAPEVLASFRELLATGAVEMLCETSDAFLDLLAGRPTNPMADRLAPVQPRIIPLPIPPVKPRTPVGA